MAHDPLTVLSPDDVHDVEVLRAENNETLGFMAMSVIEGYLKRGGGVGVRGDDGLRGYALYAVQRHHVRLIHLCVSHQYRGAGYAEQLVDAVVDAARTARVGAVKLTCRRDYERANVFWRRYGFVPLAEAEAKTDGARLMIWYLGVGGAAQLDFFSNVTSDDKVRAVIDAQIFYQLHAPENADTAVAKGLQADFLMDALDLYITKEMFNEIDRAGPSQRKRSRGYALAFPQIDHDADRMATTVASLESILPSARPSQQSDIRQLAMVANSDLSVFLTRDQDLLDRTTQIKSTIAVDVMHPNQLIVRLDEIADSYAYEPVAVSGSRLAWRRVGEREVSMLRSSDEFLGPHERKPRLMGQLERALSQPKTWRTEGLWSEGALVALRSLQRSGDRLIVGLCRAARGRVQGLTIEYAIASLLHEAVSLGCSAVEVEPHGTAPEAREEFVRLGFMRVGGKLVRVCPTAIMSEAELREAAGSAFDSVRSEGLERQCSPVVLQDGDAECLLVPIKPGYARALFNTRWAAGDLFGADEKVLLRWENVYYRKKTHAHLIQRSVRILWYVSGGNGIVAVSHLDDVEIGHPKDVFRNNRSLGTLGWREIQEMCGGSRDQGIQDIMALRFSHTHLFRSAVNFDSLKNVYRQHKLNNPVVQSPSRVPRAAFLDIFRLGFQPQASA